MSKVKHQKPGSKTDLIEVFIDPKRLENVPRTPLTKTPRKPTVGKQS